MRGFASDALVILGILSFSGGGYMFHPGVGLMLLGLALIVIGTRGAPAAGG